MKAAMTATQFFISIVVLPITTVITVLIGVLLNNNNMNHRFSDMAGRFNEIGNRFNDVNQRLNDLNNQFNQRLTDLNAQVNERLNDFGQRLTDMNGQFGQRLNDLRDSLRTEIAKNHSEMLGRFAELDGRLTRIESHLELK